MCVSGVFTWRSGGFRAWAHGGVTSSFWRMFWMRLAAKCSTTWESPEVSNDTKQQLNTILHYHYQTSVFTSVPHLCCYHYWQSSVCVSFKSSWGSRRNRRENWHQCCCDTGTQKSRPKSHTQTHNLKPDELDWSHCVMTFACKAPFHIYPFIFL